MSTPGPSSRVPLDETTQPVGDTAQQSLAAEGQGTIQLPGTGTTTIPEAVLEVSVQEDLPTWFLPYHQYVMAEVGKLSVKLTEVKTEVQTLHRLTTDQKELKIRTSGVEEDLADLTSFRMSIEDDIKTFRDQHQDINTKIDGQARAIEGITKELGRAQQRAPLKIKSDDDVQSQTQQVKAAQDQPVSFWPGSVAPPSALPPLGAVLEAAPTIPAGPSASAHVKKETIDEEKPKIDEAMKAVMFAYPNRLGPSVPYLEPKQTMLKPFEYVVDYRYYRLNDQSETPSPSELKHMWRMRERAKDLHTTLSVFDGTDPIELLEFLSTYKKAMNGMQKSEAIAVRALTYFLEGVADEAYETHMSPGVGGDDDTCTWPHVVHMLLDTFLTDENLQIAYDHVIRARQGTKEAVGDFITRIQGLARICHDVFSPLELANQALLGMKTSVRQRIMTEVNRLEPQQRTLARIRHLAVREDQAQRNEHAEMSSSTSAPPKARKGGKGSKLMHVGMPSPGAFSPPTSPTTSSSTSMVARVESPSPAHDRICVINTTASLDYVYAITEVSVRDAATKTNLNKQMILEAMEPIPDLTPEQIEQAMSVITNDYWSLSCWTCRKTGHTTFHCPKLTLQQRIFFAYCYYLHQIRSNPALKEWYKHKLAYMRGEGGSPGPKPGGNYGGRGRGGYRGQGRGGRGGYEQGAAPALPAPAAVPALPAPAATPAPTPVQILKKEDEVQSPSTSSDEGSSSENE